MSTVTFKINNTHKPIKRILVIRLQATGDVVGTLPYLQDLRNKLNSDVELDFIVREEAMSIPQSVTIFSNVYIIKGGRNYKTQFLSFLRLYPKLFFKANNNQYDRFLSS